MSAAGYRVAAEWILVAHCLMKLSRWFVEAGGPSALRTHAGPLAVLLAFVALFAGYHVTRHREQILAWIDQAE